MHVLCRSQTEAPFEDEACRLSTLLCGVEMCNAPTRENANDRPTESEKKKIRYRAVFISPNDKINNQIKDIDLRRRGKYI